MTSIILINFNGAEYTQMCVDSIVEHMSDDDDTEIIVIDNDSIEDVREYLTSGVVFKQLDENVGFPAAVNIGARMAEGDMLCILNNDTITTPGWLEHMMYHHNNGWDVVGCCTNYISGPQLKSIRPYDSQEELYWAATMNYEDFKHQFIVTHRVVGFCMLMKKDLFLGLGGFDEIYTPGNCEDDDFCLKVIKNGGVLGFARDVFIHHFGSVAHEYRVRNEPDFSYKQLLETNKAKFEEKWSKEEYFNLIKLGEERGKAKLEELMGGAR